MSMTSVLGRRPHRPIPGLAGQRPGAGEGGDHRREPVDDDQRPGVGRIRGLRGLLGVDPDRRHIGFLLDRPLVAEPGARFTYSSAAVHFLGVVLEQATGMRLPEAADELLFSGMGVERSAAAHFDWRFTSGWLRGISYGHLWWVVPEAREPFYFAWGFGGQYCGRRPRAVPGHRHDQQLARCG